MATKLLIANIPMMVCVCVAGYLCATDSDGWGWFLAIGLFTTHFIDSKK